MDFFGRLGADKLNGRFLGTLADDRKKQARQLTIDFICEKTDGPCLYLGRDMLETHKGMGINKADWDASVVDLNGTLDKSRWPARSAKRSLALSPASSPRSSTRIKPPLRGRRG